MLLSILLSVGFGVGFGTAAASVTALVFKLQVSPIEDFNQNIWLMALVGIGAMLVSMAVFFLLLRRSDMRIASSLDREYLLGERVGTMLAFSEDKGGMAALQRQDTEDKLSAVPSPRPRLSSIIALIVVVAISAALLILAIAVPKNVPSTEPPDDDEDTAYVFTEWQKTALLELIAKVKQSKMSDVPKADAVDELTDLYDRLLLAEFRSQMVTEVTGSMVVIDDTVEALATFKTIAIALSNSEDTDIRQLARALGQVESIPDTAELDNLKKIFSDVNENDVVSFAIKLELALGSIDLDKDDPVLLAVSNIVTALREVKDAFADKDADARYALVADRLDYHFGRIANSASVQSTDRAVADNIIAELMFIFGLTKDDLPVSILDNDIEYDNINSDYIERDEDELHGGGAGRDEMVYASDDELYDPESDTHVKYGEVLNKYFADMSEKLLSGELSGEFEQLIRDYFSALYSGND